MKDLNLNDAIKLLSVKAQEENNPKVQAILLVLHGSILSHGLLGLYDVVMNFAERDIVRVRQEVDIMMGQKQAKEN